MLAVPPHDLLTNASLFLDLDGTLVEIASRPDGVLVDERLHRLLSALAHRLDGRVAIISGRPVEDVQALFPNLPIAIAGSHGSEMRWPDGRLTRPPAPSVSQRVRDHIRTFETAHPDVLVERKPFGLALHYRLAPAKEKACHDFAAELMREAGYGLQTGKKVVELKATMIDKGDAVGMFLDAAPMHGTKPVFIGDDDTDEAGFRMAKRRGGAGILVGPSRATHAEYRLGSVNETLQWLAEASEAAHDLS